MKKFFWIQLLAIAAFADTNLKLSPELRNLADDKDARFIVQFIDPPSKQELAGLGNDKKLFADSKTAVVQLKGAALKRLPANPNVKYISLDRPVSLMLDYANPGVFADIAFASNWTGAGIGVAVVDSGIADHPDFKTSACGTATRLVYKANFVPGETTTNDGYGHGTHVAGIIGGNSTCAEPGMTRQFRGIAPGVNLISLRALNAQGGGSDSSVISAIDAAIALKATYNIRVLNLSLGRQIVESYTLDPLCQAVERAWKAGIVVVSSAGNRGRFGRTKGYATISSPGNDPYVITVGAMNDKLTTGRGDDVMTSFSSKGPTLIDHVAKPDIVAPGNAIVSTQAANSTLVNGNPNNRPARSSYMTNGSGTSAFYVRMSGTSMAAPMVSGAAALLLQKFPNLTPNQVKARLMRTASKALPASSVTVDSVTGSVYTTYYDTFTIGSGYLDILAALNNTALINSANPLSPRLAYVNGSVQLVTPLTTLWGDGLVWGDSLVWGSSVIWAAGADGLVWGESADGLVWGESADGLVWGESALAGESVLSGGDK